MSTSSNELLSFCKEACIDQINFLKNAMEFDHELDLIELHSLEQDQETYREMLKNPELPLDQQDKIFNLMDANHEKMRIAKCENHEHRMQIVTSVCGVAVVTICVAAGMRNPEAIGKCFNDIAKIGRPLLKGC